ncbi:MAG TPA: cytochrome P450, partial [Acidimicrobiales bacterium]
MNRFQPARLLLDGYDFIRRECDRRGTDVFATRLGPVPVICMRGSAAGQIFYSDRFQRSGAMARRVRRTLLGEGGVQGLDGPAHRHRKALFLSLMTPDALDELATLTRHEWDKAIERWQREEEPVVLLDAAGQLLCRAVHTWAGVPLTESEVAARTAQLHALIDSPAKIGPPHWRGRIARARADHWASQLIEDVRAGVLTAPEGRALHTIAAHRDHEDQLLAPDIAAVELLNVLRPTVAIDRFITFAALALVEHPDWRERLRSDDTAIDWFVQEVRRYYPFFPAAAARVRTSFDWHGVHFPAGRLVLFDLYGTNHRPDLWDQPHRFNPERFADRDISPFELVAQGGGEHADGHRCAGEWLTIQQLAIAVRVLTRDIDYTVPPQD